MCHPDRDVSPSTRGISEHRYSVAVSDADLPVFAVSPAEEARGAVIVIHDVYGARPFYEDLCRRFAAEGYGAMLPDLFVRQGALSEETREAAFARSATFSYPRAIEDLRALISDFKADDEAKIGTVGFCMGGTLVMLLAAREPDVSAGVVYYGFPRNAQPTELRPYEPLQETAQVQSPLLGF
jgi:carboxymethylenebutenolidase